MKRYCYYFLDGKWITEEFKVKSIGFGTKWQIVDNINSLQSFETLNVIFDGRRRVFFFYSIKSLTDYQKEKLIKTWKKQWCENETV